MKEYNSGFTLVEIAMVLFIVTLLLAGLIPTITAQLEQQRTNETRKKISEIKEALIGYAVINGQLPCPADPTIISGQTGAGIKRNTCTTSANSTGVVPWATLGVNETDAWGNRFTYRVTPEFADAISLNTFGFDFSQGCASTSTCTPPSNPPFSSFALCSCGAYYVNSAATGGVTVTANVPAVIISHGKNGAGAYTPQGTQLSVGSNLDENDNSNGAGDSKYVNHTPTSGFDDLVDWITPNILYNRMVVAGKLP
ncbi:MAG: type II secretion system protein [Pseudomonadota bacterium]